MYKIKEISIDLGISPQAIYNQKKKLVENGYMIKNTDNSWEITNNGYEYLKNNKIKRIKQKQTSLINKNNDIQMVMELYEKQIEELHKQIEYFKALYEEEKMEKIKILDKLIKNVV